jgi:hypothetical protein
VPRKQPNGVLGINCENQKNQHLQFATLTTQQGQEAISTTYVMQQQCHLATTSIQGQSKVNRLTNTSRWAKWIDQQLKDAIHIVEKGHISLRMAMKYCKYH